MSCRQLRPVTPSAIIEEILREYEESVSDLSDQGSEKSDHIVPEEPQASVDSGSSDLEEEDLPLSEITSCFTAPRNKVTKWKKVKQQ